MDPRAAPLADIVRLNTRLFHNCLDGMSDEQAHARPSDRTNSAAFVAAHVADTRYFLLRVLGDDSPNPLAAALDGARGIDDLRVCPSVPDVVAAWDAASAAIAARLETITASELDEPIEMRFPVDRDTVLGALTFLVQHESYHIGQLALLRKHAGLPGMRYG